MAHRQDDRWTRRYPPLVGVLVATLLAVFVLPSALNVPQSNPTQTLEFAPVPPEDDAPPPRDAGNTESLALGSSDTTPRDDGARGGDDDPGLPPPPEVPEGEGTRPVTKRCVGDPPRQTEDKLAPPCVAHFEGDNGGATAQGVTGDEIVVLAVEDSGFVELTSRGTERRPVKTFRNYYTQLRQFFTGVQVAGPGLTPESMDRGFHAIPPVPSTDPRVPACYYDPGDYTCVKDAAVGWWDPEATNSFGTGAASNRGCWRMAEGGRRYLIDDWPDGDVTAQRGLDDPCNQYSGQFFLYRDH